MRMISDKVREGKTRHVRTYELKADCKLLLFPDNLITHDGQATPIGAYYSPPDAESEQMLSI